MIKLKDLLNEEKPGLWANIRAKRARGEKPAHGNSDAHKDAVKAGKEINKEESVSEGLYHVGYNKGRGQGTGVFKDSYSSYKDAKKAVEKLEKERGGSYNMVAYYVSDKDGKFVKESVTEALTGKEKKIKDGNPDNIFYAFYKGQFDAVYWAMNPTDLFNIYWDEFKVRRPAGSKFKLNPEFVVISKKDYDRSPNHYSKLKPFVDKFWDKLQKESVTEAKAPYEVYHKSYTSAIEAAREYAEKKGFEIDNDDSFRKIGMGPRKPSEGKTNSFSIQLSKDGKLQRKQLHIQVYGMKNSYELNAYIG
jgi:hypothetical protein